MSKHNKNNKGMSLKKLLGKDAFILDKKFGIKTLAEVASGKKSFSINELVEERKKKTQELVNMYNTVYQTCINNIKKANIEGKDYLLFLIPDFFNNSKINHDECYYYLSEKLKHKQFNVCHAENNYIFISWKEALSG